MSKKIFVTYKYSDSNVYQLKLLSPMAYSLGLPPPTTTARHYVNKLQYLLEKDDHINKGENDGETLSNFKNSTIESKLRNKIYDSSITIIMISPGMKETHIAESDQWIPWEIAYSLKEHSRGGRTSHSNAMLAIVLPDRNNSYEYFVEHRNCCTRGCRIFKTDNLFQIIRNNMFNLKNKSLMDCSQHLEIYQGHCSYIHTVKWSDFIQDVNSHLIVTININEDISAYEIIKIVQ